MAEYLFKEALPDFYAEIEKGLMENEDEDARDLVSQLPDLVIVSRCRCRQSDCASFTVRSTNVARHKYSGYSDRSFVIESHLGGCVIDIDNESRIVFIEVLDRNDVRKLLNKLGLLWADWLSNPDGE